MLPPPPPASGPATSPDGEPSAPQKQRAGLAVLVVALAVLLGLVALVWWINEQDNDDDPWRSRGQPAAVVRSRT
jgi:hypothetical protein